MHIMQLTTISNLRLTRQQRARLIRSASNSGIQVFSSAVNPDAENSMNIGIRVLAYISLKILFFKNNEL